MDDEHLSRIFAAVLEGEDLAFTLEGKNFTILSPKISFQGEILQITGVSYSCRLRTKSGKWLFFYSLSELRSFCSKYIEYED
jgi:hypothetical protein